MKGGFPYTIRNADSRALPDTYVGAGHARRSVRLAGYQGRKPCLVFITSGGPYNSSNLPMLPLGAILNT
jgi:hypothetical protein